MDPYLFVATLLSPVIAVIVTLWWQERKETRDEKLKLFTIIMANRKSYPISYELAKALNLIDVIFADAPAVLNAWHEYYGILSQKDPNPETRGHKFIHLLSVMAKSLGYRKIEQTDIDKFYIPQLHFDHADFQGQVNAEWLRVLKASARFVVEPRNDDTARHE